MRFSEAEEAAIKSTHHGILVSKIEDRSFTDVFGCVIPGMRVFKGLERKGILIITEEDPVTFEDDMGETFEFTFTPSVELTDIGNVIYRWMISGDISYYEQAMAMMAEGKAND